MEKVGARLDNYHEDAKEIQGNEKGVKIYMNIIETHDLTKCYGDFAAVSHVSLHIPKVRSTDSWGLTAPENLPP